MYSRVFLICLFSLGLFWSSYARAEEEKQGNRFRTLEVPADFATVQEAIDAARFGDTVRVKPGIYREAITFKNGVRLLGTDREKCRIEVAEQAAAAITSQSCVTGLIAELTIDGRGIELGDGTPNGIVLKDSRLEVRDCVVKNFNGLGIFVSGETSNVVLKGNTCRENGWSGIALASKSKARILGNICEKNRQSGILVAGAEVVLKGNQCRSNQADGVEFGQGAHGFAEHNLCQDNRSGIAVMGAGSSLDLNQNECRANKNFGIYFGGGAVGTVADNTCAENSGGIGVYDEDTSPELFQNTCAENNGHGIEIGKGAVSVVKENDCRGNGTCGIGVHGTKTSPQLRGNRCWLNIVHGIVFEQGAVGAASENDCSKNQSCGIAVFNEETSPVLNANRCTKNSLHGIYFGSGTAGAATANICISNSSDGIAANGKGAAPVLEANHCHDNGHWGINHWEDATPRIAGNNIARDNSEGQIRELAAQDTPDDSAKPRAARTLVVPDKYSAIQKAIDAAIAGDTVQVNPGNYRETITFKSGIQLVGTDREKCRIEARDESTAVITASKCESGRIANLTIDGRGVSSGKNSPVGILLANSTVRVSNCVVENLQGTAGILVKGNRSDVIIEENLCRNNATFGVLFQEGATGTAQENTCQSNNFGMCVFGSGTDPMLADNNCSKNKRFGLLYGQGAVGGADRNVCENNEVGIFVGGGGTAPTLVRNTCSNNKNQGLLYTDAAAGTAFENQCEANEQGIHAFGADTAPWLVQNSCQRNAAIGILIADQASGFAADNVIQSNEVGISVVGAGTAPTILRNNCSQNTLTGILFAQGATGLAVGNTCSENEKEGIVAVNSKTAPTLKQNVCNANAVAGIRFDDGAAGNAEGNTCEENGQGIRVLEPTTIPRLEGNVCRNNKLDGIYFAKGATGRVHNNTCEQNRQHGIEVVGKGTTPILKANKCSNNEDWGIHFSDSAHPIIAANNAASGNKQGQVQGRKNKEVPADASRQVTVTVPDDFASIQSAIDLVDAGDTVQVKPGTYRQALRFKNGIRLVGTDRAKCRIEAPDDAIAVIIADACEHGLIANLTINGRGVRTALSQQQTDAVTKFDRELKVFRRLRSATIRRYYPSGIVLLESTLEVSNCAAEHLQGAGIWVRGPASRPTISKSECQANKFCGIYFEHGASGTAFDNSCHSNEHGIFADEKSTAPYLVQNTCSKNLVQGILFANGAGGGAEENTCEANGLAGITAAHPETAPEIKQNICRSNKWCGIYFRNDTTGRITGNTCELNEHHGIVFEMAARGSASENTCFQNEESGIAVFGEGTAPELSANQCAENGSHGVQFGDGARGTAKDNICEGNKGHGMLVWGKRSAPVLDGNQCLNNSLLGIDFQNASGLGQHNVCEGNQTGISVHGQLTDVKLLGNTCRGNIRYGLLITDGATVAAEGNTCADSTMGIFVLANSTGGASFTLKDNVCRENKSHGISILSEQHAAQGTATGNLSEKNGECGISVVGEDTDVRLLGNKCIDNANGIMITENAVAVAEENTCRSTVANSMGILVNGASAELKENQCIENGAVGIYFQGRASGTAIGNTCSNNEAGILVTDLGTSPTLSANRCDHNRIWGIIYSNRATPTIDVDNTGSGNETGQIMADPVLQRAINAAQPGETVHVQPGVHQGPIILKDGVSLVGTDREKCRIEASGLRKGNIIEAEGCTNVLIANLTIVGDFGSFVTGLRLIDSKVEVRNCVIQETFKAIGFADAKGPIHGSSTFAENLVENNSIGIDIDRGIVTVEGNRCERNITGGITVSGLDTEVTLKRNICKLNRGSGITIAGATAELEANYCNENRGSGVEISGGRVTARNNECERNLSVGISIGSATVQLDGNVCRDNKGGGIYGWNANGAIVANRCERNSFGIEIYRPSRELKLLRNTCRNNVHAGISILTSATPLVEGNTCDQNSNGIEVNGQGTAPQLKKNTCHENRQHGIYFSYRGGGTVVENICEGNGAHGIHAEHPHTEPELRTNECNNNGGWGIHCVGGAAPKIAGDNQCQGNALGQAVEDPVLQRAINAAQTGETVRVEPGVYRERLVLKDGVSLVGVDREKCHIEALELERGRVGLLTALTYSVPLISAENCRSGVIANLTITGGGSSLIGIYLNQSNVEVRNCLIGFAEYGIWHEQGTATLRNNVCTDGNVGIFLSDGSKGLAEDNLCMKCKFAGIRVEGDGTDVTLKLNKCIGSDFGISLDNGATVIAENNTCGPNNDSGIINAGAKSTLTGNICKNNRKHGIRLCDAASGAVTGNTCEKNGRHGISVEGFETSPTLKANRCNENLGWGIDCRDGATPLIAADNAGTGNKLGQVIPEPILQKAINAAEPGETVKVQPGIYRERLTLKEGVSLLGTDRDKCLIVSPDKEANPDLPTYVIKVHNCSEGKIANLTIDGSGAARMGIYLYASNFEVRNCVVKNAGDAIYIDGGKATLTDNICRNGKTGIRFHRSSQGTVLGNTCEDNQSAGICVDGEGTEVTLSGNICRRNEIGISLQNRARTVAEHNTCDANTKSGIDVRHPRTSVQLTQNICQNNETYGISFDLAATGNAEGNICQGNQAFGIGVLGPRTTPKLKDNVLRENKQGKIKTENAAENDKPKQLKLLVPDDFPNIQMAIDAAQPGDTVQVQPGLYRESITFKNGINLVGVDRQECKIAPPEFCATLIRVTNCDQGLIANLTIDGRQGALIGIAMEDSNLVVRNCFVIRARVAGILAQGKKCSPTIEENTVVLNRVGISIMDGAAGTATGNICDSNTSDGIAIIGSGTSPNLTANQCSNNSHWGIMQTGGASVEIGSDHVFENNEAGSVKPELIIVPDMAPTIQRGIDLAEAGDTVQVKPGTYREPIRLKTGIRLIGTERDGCRIEGTLLPGPVVNVANARDVTISGFTIDGRYNNWGINLFASTAVVTNCRLEHCSTAGMMVAGDSHVTLQDNIIRNNRGAAISLMGGNAVLERNDCSSNYDGMTFAGGVTAKVVQNTCNLNEKHGIAASGAETKLELIDNKCAYNEIGLRLRFGTTANAVNNTCDNNKWLGIEAVSCQVNLQGNSFCRNIRGIQCEAGTKGVASQNTCNNNISAGIVVTGSGTQMELVENVCLSNIGWGIVFSYGSGGAAIGNVCKKTCTAPSLPFGPELERRLNPGRSFGAGIEINGLLTAPQVKANRCTENDGWGIACTEGSLPTIAGDNILEGNWTGKILETDVDKRPRVLVVPDQFPSIGQALEEAKLGDVVEVKPGTYRERIVLKHYVPLIGTDRDGCQIVCPDNDSEGDQQEAMITADKCTAFVRNLTLIGRNKSPRGIHARGSEIVVGNCVVDSAGEGIRVDGGSATLTDNICRNGKVGIQLTGAAVGTVNNNTCENNSSSGILLSGVDTTPDLSDNRCHNNGGWGIECQAEAVPNISPSNLASGNKLGQIVELAVLQKAIDAAKPGDTVFVQPGIYREYITLKDGVSLVGTDRAKCWILSPVSGKGSARATSIVAAHDCNGGVISNLTIDGRNSNVIGIYLEKCKVQVTNCVVENAECGIWSDQGTDTLNENLCHNCKDGIHLFGSVNGIAKSNICWENSEVGIAVTGGSVTLQENQCRSNTYGIRTFAGISSDPTVHATGNQCSQNKKDGIFFHQVGGSAVGNICGKNGGHGIRANATIPIQANHCDENGGWGISFKSPAAPEITDDNVGRGNKLGQIMADPALQRAINAAKPGDTVSVQPGTYRESILLKSGVSLVGQDRDKCRIVSPFAAEDPDRPPTMIGAFQCSSGTIANLSIDGRDTVSSGISLVDSKLEIRNCLVEHVNTGVSVERGAATLNQNECRNGMVGIRVFGGSKSTLTGNNCEANSTAGILVVGTDTKVISQQNRGVFSENGTALTAGNLDKSDPIQVESILQRAIDAAQPGEIVRVQPGTYRETIQLKDGVSLVGTDRDKCRIEIDKPVRAIIAAENCSSGVIANLTIDGGNAAQLGIELVDCQLEIRNCVVANARYGVRVEGGSVVLKNNICRKTDLGICLLSVSSGILEGNKFADQKLSAIWVDGYDTDVTLKENEGRVVRTKSPRDEADVELLQELRNRSLSWREPTDSVSAVYQASTTARLADEHARRVALHERTAFDGLQDVQRILDMTKQDLLDPESAAALADEAAAYAVKAGGDASASAADANMEVAGTNLAVALANQFAAQANENAARLAEMAAHSRLRVAKTTQAAAELQLAVVEELYLTDRATRQAYTAAANESKANLEVEWVTEAHDRANKASEELNERAKQSNFRVMKLLEQFDTWRLYVYEDSDTRAEKEAILLLRGFRANTVDLLRLANAQLKTEDTSIAAAITGTNSLAPSAHPIDIDLGEQVATKRRDSLTEQTNARSLTFAAHASIFQSEMLTQESWAVTINAGQKATRSRIAAYLAAVAFLRAKEANRKAELEGSKANNLSRVAKEMQANAESVHRDAVSVNHDASVALKASKEVSERVTQSNAIAEKAWETAKQAFAITKEVTKITNGGKN